MMNDLRNLKETKIAQLDMMREMDQNVVGEKQEHITHEIQAAIMEKDHLSEVLQQHRALLEQKERKIDQFQTDLLKMYVILPYY